MADSPTFSESWYRVAELRPRLRATVRVHRQSFRGQLWHVVQDEADRHFFRLHEAAYRFVGLLDGRRTAAQAWRICNARLGDEALTQNEAIEVLGQLYAANLLAAELPPDAEGLFQRHRRRRGREIRGRLGNLLFLRIPLFDPDGLLDRLVGIVGAAFTPVGFLLWLLLVSAGAYFALSRAGELAGEAKTMLGAGRLAANLPALYAVFMLAKLCHEFGHAFACKKFGRQAHTGGEVHEMGIMFLVLAPMPYMDASGAWAFRSKLHRTVVAAAGMMTELALAAVAAVVWAWTGGAADAWVGGVHALAFQLMLIASISTLLFNGNPLLRFDAYYILADLLEIPNLDERSRKYLYWVVKRHAWGVREVINPATTGGEAAWLAGYAVAATLFRVFICVRILLLLSERFFLIGSVLAAAAAVRWVLLPLGRFVGYLLGGAELARVRARAVTTTLVVLAGALAPLGLANVPDRWRVEGVVEPAELAFVHARVDGVVRGVLPSGRRVRAKEPDTGLGSVLVASEDRDLELELNDLLHEREILMARQRLAHQKSTSDRRYLALTQVLQRDLEDLDRQVEIARGELALLTVRASLDGTWLSPQAERLEGMYLRRGERLGLVASLDRLIIRAPAGQRLAGMLIAEEAQREVEIRLKGRPGARLQGTIERILPAPRGDAEPSQGGAPPAAAQDLQPRVEVQAPPARERSFEVYIRATGTNDNMLIAGQRVAVQFQMPPSPLLAQWWRSLRQLALSRFHV
ncbi:MAG: hypothetical protein AMJ81_11590 [Phycisphaerae bacterium SM23_33]|nr:MAG: hypothetical protein AMJ81_11590 [Phycisphaerae bacterium SM23_33]